MPWQGRKQKPPKGQTKGYLSICSSYTPWAVAKAGGEMADGLQSYSNAPSLNHYMGNNLSPHRAILPCAFVCTGESSPAPLEMQYFCKCITHWQNYFCVLLLVIGTSSENSSSSKTCVCSSAFLVPSENPKGALNITLDSGTEINHVTWPACQLNKLHCNFYCTD